MTADLRILKNGDPFIRSILQKGIWLKVNLIDRFLFLC